MPAIPYNESHVEAATLDYLQALGWTYAHGPDLAPDGAKAERESWDQVLLPGRLRAAVDRLNPAVSRASRDDAVRQVAQFANPDLLHANRAFHKMLTERVPVARIVAANPTTDTDRQTTAALRLLDTALPPAVVPPSPMIERDHLVPPSPMIGRGTGGEGRTADGQHDHE